VNVAAYTGLWQMPTVEQLDATVGRLRREGGDKIFIGQFWWNEIPSGLGPRASARRDRSRQPIRRVARRARRWVTREASGGAQRVATTYLPASSTRKTSRNGSLVR
jgi:hypothetical protein